MKLLVIGAQGQLGSDLVPVLCEQGDGVLAPSRRELDVTDAPSVRDLLGHYRPQVVINCSVYHPIDECEIHPDLSLAVNALAVRELALACNTIGAILVHISSDYVFDGEQVRPYVETDPTCPRSVFGVSKVAGEQFIRNALPQHFILRTSGLYGLVGSRAKRGNFVETMLRLGYERGKVRVVNDLRMAQTYTRSLARQISALVRTSHFGTYHASDHGDYSWYEFAGKIFQYAQLDVDVTPVSWQEMSGNAMAPRPRYSVLRNLRLQQLGLDCMRPIDESLKAYLRERRAVVVPAGT